MDENTSPLETSKGEEAIELTSIALEAIPYVGGVLSSAASYYLEKRRSRRLNQFLIDLAAELQSAKDRLNRDFIGTDEFENLVEDVLSKASDTRQQEKLDAYRNIFLNTILSDQPFYNETVEILNIVDRLQPRHILVLKILSDPIVADQQMGNVVGPGGGFSTSIGQIMSKLLPDWDAEQIGRTWAELYDYRLHNTTGINTMMTDRGIHQLEGRLTNFGMKVIKYVLYSSEQS